MFSVRRAVFCVARRVPSVAQVRGVSTVQRSLAKMQVKPAFMAKAAAPAPAAVQLQTRGMANHRHKKVIKLAKGFRGRGKNCYSIAFRRVQKARQYQYRDRKVKKREFRKLWIMRINAAARIYGMPYSHLVRDLAKANILLDRKSLAELAIYEPLSFKSVLEVARSA